MSNKNNFKLVSERLMEAQELLRVGAERGKLSSIERDILLEKLRVSYEAVLFDRAEPPVYDNTNKPERSVDTEKSSIETEEPPVKQESNSNENRNEASFPKAEIDDKQSEKEIVTDSPQPKAEQKSAVAQEEPFVIDDEEVSKQVEDSESQDVSEQTEISAENVEVDDVEQDSNESESNGKSTTILAEKFQGKRKFRNEVLANGKRDMATHLKNKPISDLTKAIGINDKFLFTKELFNGNAEQYAKSIRTLNSFDDINDALIYIQENFSWDDNNEAANQLIDLVRRKLLHD